MSLIDIVIIALIAIAFALVVRRICKKGTCADCSGGDSCRGSCGKCGDQASGSCPACMGVEHLANKLGRDVKGMRDSD